MTPRRIAALVLAILALTVFPRGTTHAAETYPNRLIKFVVTFPAGGPVDVMGRLIANELTTVLGQQVIVDRRA
jgi:tripartite-type tricarboxylate transporter receptor subunit TctC